MVMRPELSGWALSSRAQDTGLARSGLKIGTFQIWPELMLPEKNNAGEREQQGPATDGTSCTRARNGLPSKQMTLSPVQPLSFSSIVNSALGLSGPSQNRLTVVGTQIPNSILATKAKPKVWGREAAMSAHRLPCMWCPWLPGNLFPGVQWVTLQRLLLNLWISGMKQHPRT